MHKRIIFAVLGALALAFPAIAQQGAPAASDQLPQALELTAAQRSQIAEQIISRWMGPVMKSPGGDVKRWSAKLREVVATADSANVIRASQMPSFALIHAALIGATIDDAAMREALSGTQSTSAPQILGSYSGDTTYTPLPNGRCRVASSLALNIPLSAGVVRGIEVEAVTSYSSQGGTGSLTGNSSTACGIPTLATALAVSVSARNPVADGVLKVFPYDVPNSAGNTIFFSAAAGGGGSDLIVRNCQSCSFEIALMATAQTDYIVDVIGYFMPPQATALSCVRGPSRVVSVPPTGETAFGALACPSGYTETSTQCGAVDFTMQLVSASGLCAAKNNGGTAANLTAYRVCCRVPGR